MLRLLTRPRHWPLGMLAAAILLAFVLAGIVAQRIAVRKGGPEERAHALAAAGKTIEAGTIYWSLLERGPVTVPLVIDFLDCKHSHLPPMDFEGVGENLKELEKVVTKAVTVFGDDARFTALLAKESTPPEAKLLGLYWSLVLSEKITEELRKPVVDAADATPPLPWANRLLAREHFARHEMKQAADRFEREALYVQDHREDAHESLEIWAAEKDWDAIGERVRDPRWKSLIPSDIARQYAAHTRDWPLVLKWCAIDALPDATPGVFAIASVTAGAWFWFCATIGRIGARLSVRGPLYVTAFILGMVSVYPTVIFITLEDELLHFHANGNPIADLIFYVFGVGLREEGAKILLFLPLLPLLRKRGDRREALAVGALVGLGFAASENVQYFYGDVAPTALARFLMANFFHMALTGIASVAIYDYAAARSRSGEELGQAIPFVIVMHGLYDFFISNASVARLSFLTIVVFVFITRKFLGAMSALRGASRETRGPALLRKFVIMLSCVAGSGYVYACMLAGPMEAFRAVFLAALEMAVIVIMFVQEFGAL